MGCRSSKDANQNDDSSATAALSTQAKPHVSSPFPSTVKAAEAKNITDGAALQWESKLFAVQKQDVLNQFPEIKSKGEFETLKQFEHFINQTLERDGYPGSRASILWEDLSEEEILEEGKKVEEKLEKMKEDEQKKGERFADETRAKEDEKPAKEEKDATKEKKKQTETAEKATFCSLSSCIKAGNISVTIPSSLFVKIYGSADLATEVQQLTKLWSIALTAHGEFEAWIQGGGTLQSGWYYSIDWGCPVTNYNIVQLLHFPPTDSGFYSDFLYAETLTRWNLLCHQNGMTNDVIKQQQRILDLVPMVAPAGDGRKLPNTAFHKYPLQSLDTYLSFGLSTTDEWTRPIIGFGKPVVDWFNETFSHKFQKDYPNGVKFGDVVVLNGLASANANAKTPVLMTNHPSAWTYNSGVIPKDWPNPVSGGYPSPDTVIQQDLISAGWHTRMVSGRYNKEGGPQQAYAEAQADWTDLAQVHNVEYQHQAAFSYWVVNKTYGPSPVWPNQLKLMKQRRMDGTDTDFSKKLFLNVLETGKPLEDEKDKTDIVCPASLNWSSYSIPLMKQTILEQFSKIGQQGDQAAMKYFQYLINQSLVHDGNLSAWASIVWKTPTWEKKEAEVGEKKLAKRENMEGNGSQMQSGSSQRHLRDAVPHVIYLKLVAPANIQHEAKAIYHKIEDAQIAHVEYKGGQ